MKIKTGAKAAGVKPEMVLALTVAADLYKKYGQELVVTELTGGKHGRGSLHYVGLGADLRTNYFNHDEAAKVALELREKLGEEFDVILEKTHIHLEFQPK